MAIIRLTNGNDKFQDKPTGNTIYGRDGNDQINGNGGSDNIYGERGSDRINLDSGEYGTYGRVDGGPGNDILQTSSYDGNIIGGSGDDVIDAGAIYLTVSGGDGNDDLSSSGRSISVRGGNGNDDIEGIASSDDDGRYGAGISGEGGNDRPIARVEGYSSGYGFSIFGGDGDDTIFYGTEVRGGLGKDVMLSGGDTVFVFDDLDSAPGLRRDRINSFSTENDQLDLRLIDGDRGRLGDQSLVYIEDAEFSGPGEVRLSGGVLQISTDADRAAEVEIQLGLSSGSLAADNFLL